MDLLTKEQLLKAQNRRYEVSEVPGLGGMVRFASLSAEASLEHRALARRHEAGEDVNKQIMVFLLSETLVDSVGRQLFTPEETVAFLKTITPETMQFLVEKATDLISGGKKQPRLVEGNSEASQSAA